LSPFLFVAGFKGSCHWVGGFVCKQLRHAAPNASKIYRENTSDRFYRSISISDELCVCFFSALSLASKRAFGCGGGGDTTQSESE